MDRKEFIEWVESKGGVVSIERDRDGGGYWVDVGGEVVYVINEYEYGRE